MAMAKSEHVHNATNSTRLHGRELAWLTTRTQYEVGIGLEYRSSGSLNSINTKKDSSTEMEAEHVSSASAMQQSSRGSRIHSTEKGHRCLRSAALTTTSISQIWTIGGRDSPNKK
jgi:hypothetical protein